MDIRKALDDLLQEHHYRLSIMAIHGYYGIGRGAIPLQITVMPFHDQCDDLVRISVREYYTPTDNGTTDPDLVHQMQAYDPTDTGLLLFQVEPGDWSGCLAFSLARTAKVHYLA